MRHSTSLPPTSTLQQWPSHWSARRRRRSDLLRQFGRCLKPWGLWSPIEKRECTTPKTWQRKQREILLLHVHLQDKPRTSDRTPCGVGALEVEAVCVQLLHLHVMVAPSCAIAAFTSMKRNRKSERKIIMNCSVRISSDRRMILTLNRRKWIFPRSGLLMT